MRVLRTSLATMCLYKIEPANKSDYVILNGAGMFERARPFLEQHKTIGLWLDNDATGRKHTHFALSFG